MNPRREIIVYVYTPLPAGRRPELARGLKLAPLRDVHGEPVEFPTTPEEWTERRWVDYACHADAPWLSDRAAAAHPRFRHRACAAGFRPCRTRARRAGRKAALRALASWRYSLRRYDRPWELDASQRLIGLLDPRVTSI